MRGLRLSALGRKMKRQIPRPPIEAVLRELGATDIPSGYGWVRMPCFRHEDRTPSAAVNHEVNGYRCHSCCLSGDGLKLLQEVLGLTWKDALRRAQALGGPIESKPTKKPWRASDLLRRD